MKSLLAVLVVIGLSGCTAIEQIWSYGAAANDAALHGAKKVICEGASIRAWSAEYGSDPAKAEAWRRLCLVKQTESPR